MNILVCVKRVPATGGRMTLTADEPRHRHALPRLRRQPARGMRGRGGGPDHRGRTAATSVVMTLGPTRRPTSCATRWRSASTGRSCSRRTDRDWDPVATAAALVDAIRALEAAGGPFDLILFGERIGRLRRVPGRDPGGDRARPADRDGREGARDRPTGPSTARREAPGGWEMFEVPLPGGRRGSRGDQPAALSVGARPDASEEEGDRAGDAARRSRAGPS